ncbi:MAG: DUF6273 domain-containing protein [Defluviitaleaceae bacterium]|nr:DUF6273 domain-containing protein [Defluviitaleaceae bacterium]
MRKHFYAILLILALSLLVSCINENEEAAIYVPDDKVIQIGHIIWFGNHYWRVLEVFDDNTALIITENVIESGAGIFHNTWGSLQSVTWEDSDIRAHLNSEFLYTFTTEEQNRILPTHVHTPRNEW